MLVDADILAVAHTNGLINIIGSGTEEKIELTDKGKHFISRYLAEQKQ